MARTPSWTVVAYITPPPGTCPPLQHVDARGLGPRLGPRTCVNLRGCGFRGRSSRERRGEHGRSRRKLASGSARANRFPELCDARGAAFVVGARTRKGTQQPENKDAEVCAGAGGAADGKISIWGINLRASRVSFLA